MVKLKDVVKGIPRGDSTNKNAVISITKNISVQMLSTPVAVLGISRDKQSKFSEQATALVTDDKFLDELQDKIGKPLANESEGEFVAKAKIKMRELLKSKL